MSRISSLDQAKDLGGVFRRDGLREARGGWRMDGCRAVFHPSMDGTLLCSHKKKKKKKWSKESGGSVDRAGGKTV